MSGMFQRIARRHADGSEEPAASEAADGQTPNAAVDAPTEQVEPVAPAPDADQPTAFQPAVAAEEQPTTIQPAAAATPPAATDDQPTTLQPAASAPPSAAAPATQQPTADVDPGTTDAVVPEAAPRRPGFRARGRMRRRLRYLRKLREIQVRDLGGLAFDLRRFERKRDDLVAQKIDQIRACDDELRALELALGERRDLRDVREPGIGGTCPRCFAIFGSADRFCASCGAALGGAVQGPAQVPVVPAPPPAAAPLPPAAPPEVSGSGPSL
jgi:hypothetical protein